MDGQTIITGDACEELKKMPDCCIDCCITSPPYYGLRDYGVAGQIGLEETPSEYIEKLVAVFREVRHVIKNDGTLWINMGDSYIRKNLMGIPWRLAFALQADGWYLRQDIIWYKPNCMPESVKDRCTKSHEYIFLLSKSDKYYFDYEAIKEPAVGFNNIPPAGSKGTSRPNSRRRKGNSKTFRDGAYINNQAFNNSGDIIRDSRGNTENTTGLRNKRDVWCVSTQGCKEAHFATFLEKLVESCVLAGCRSGGTVLDPFIGSGTTAIVAKKNGRNCIGIELNSDYSNIALKRIKEVEQA